MGDWKTLHMFNDQEFFSEIIPSIKSNTDFLFNAISFTNENRFFNRYYNPKELHNKALLEIKQYISELNTDLSTHIKLQNLHIRDKKEPYDIHIKRINEGYEKFIYNRKEVEFYPYLITDIIFRAVAIFNPYFRLGKNAFDGAISTTKGSIAEEVIEAIKWPPNQGSILDVYDSGITNWVTNEDLKLLSLDQDNILPTNLEDIEYVNEFKEFLKIAVKNDFGFISLRNPNEDLLLSHSSNNTLKIELTEKLSYRHILTHQLKR